jgi:hypothetical protein
MLNLRGKTRQFFFQFIAEKLPQLSAITYEYPVNSRSQPIHILDNLRTLYSTDNLRREHRQQLYKTLSGLMKEYGLSPDYGKHIGEMQSEPEFIQLEFDM